MTKYNNAEGIRRSDLWVINRSPFHFYHHMTTDKEQSKAMAFGAAVHAYILEPDTFADLYAVAPEVDRRTKAGREEWRLFTEACDVLKKEAVTESDMGVIMDMAAALRQNPLAVQLLNGRHEQEYYWTDDMTGEKCKCKVDCVTEYNGQPIIVDYKTTDSCEDGHFERSARRYGYQFQAGMYCEGLFQNTLTEHGFAFVAQEKQEPYAVRVYFCDPEWILRGYDKYRELIGIYHQCKESGIWPGYGDAMLMEVES